MTEPFDVFAYVHDLLQVLILPVSEDWVVDDDTVDFVVMVGREERVFNLLLVNLAEIKVEATGCRRDCSVSSTTSKRPVFQTALFRVG